LVGVIPRAQFRISDSNQTEQSGNFRIHVGDGRLVKTKSFGNLKPNGENRIQGGGGLLEDVGEFAAPRFTKVSVRAGEEVCAVLPENLTGETTGGRRRC
jgi:hypothetical protein